MDILREVLVIGVVLSPLIAAAAVAAIGLSERRPHRLAVRFAQLGAAASACFALGVLVTQVGADLATQSPVSLGSWFVHGPRDLLRVSFGLRFDALTAALAVVLAISTGCLFTAHGSEESHSPADRWFPLGGSLLLFASIGVAASTNLAELFVFWAIGTAVAYSIVSLSAETAQHSVSARKLVLVLSVADACLICAVFILAAGVGTLDFQYLFGRPEAWARAATQRAALVDLVGLCLLGACIGRCGLVPFLGWIGDLAARPARLAAMIQAIAVVPCGAVLLIRCFPLFGAASAILPLAAFVGGSSAFCLAVCAVASNDARRSLGFACASVLGTMLLGFSTGQSASPAIALGLTAAFVPSATAILIAGGTGGNVGGRRWSSVARLLLFSGVCGQAWLLGGALQALFAGPGRDALALLLSVLLAACGQYLAAAATVRSLRLGDGIGNAQRDEALSSTPIATNPAGPRSLAGRLILLTVAALAAALLAALLNARAIPAIFSGRTLAYAALGLIPGIGGLVAGTQSARAEWRVFPGESANGLLMRLGHSGFYFDVFLFLFVLVPLRGVAALARFVDWAVIDTLATGGPASLFESAAAFFGPLQHRGVVFYLFSAILGTAVLSVLLIWLQA